jgi:hypothetical protein
MIKQILHHWKEKIGGYIKRDKQYLYKDDYYLNFSNTEDNNTHVHLVKNNFYTKNINSNSNIFFQLIPNTNIGYVVQKNNKYLEPVKIYETDSPDKICLQMINLYENFDRNYYLRS